MKNLSNEKKRLRVLSFCVIAFHFVFFLPAKKTENIKPIAPQKIVVHTFIEKEKPIPKIKTVNSQPKVIKQSIKKTPVKKVTAKKKKIPAKKIAKKQEPPKVVPKKSVSPPPKKQKQIPTSDLLQKQREYETKVISFFQEALVLPEQGKVKVEVIIWKSGKVKNCKVLFFENEKNKIYLEKMMSSLQLPSFMGLKKSSDTHTLTFTFCNISH